MPLYHRGVRCTSPLPFPSLPCSDRFLPAALRIPKCVDGFVIRAGNKLVRGLRGTRTMCKTENKRARKEKQRKKERERGKRGIGNRKIVTATEQQWQMQIK